MNRTRMHMTDCARMLGVVGAVLSLAAAACAQQQEGSVADPTGVGSAAKKSAINDQLTEAKRSKCPPDSLLFLSRASIDMHVFITCENGVVIVATIPAGGELVIRRDGNCGLHPNCISCGPLKVMTEGGGVLFECDMQNAYFDAYGIDLAAIGHTITDADLERPKKTYNTDGDPIRLRYFAVPVIDGEGDFVEWEFTTVKPNFSVEDGEVVIRDNRQRIIGDRTGITLEK